MVTELLKLQLKRLNRQKLLYLYFVIMAALIISNAFQCTDNSANTGMEYYAGGIFRYFVCNHILILLALYF